MKKHIFWKVYGLIVVLASVCILVFFFIFWNFLQSYEKSQPKYEMDKVIELFKQKNSPEIIKYSTYNLSAFENDEILIKALDNTLTDGDWQYTQSGETYTKNTPVYDIKKDGVKVATVTLVKSQTKGSFHTTKWEISQIDNLLKAKNDPYIITAPSNAKVYVNGIILTDEYKSEDNIGISELSTSAKYVSVPTYVKYKVSGLYSDPTITATGSVFNMPLDVVSQDKQATQFKFESNPDFNSSQENRIITITQIYGKYVTNDATFSSISPYIIGDSKAYSFLKTVASANIWIAAHSAPQFNDMVVSNYQMYASNCFSCDVSFTLKVNALNKSYEYPTKLRYYFVKINESWNIADLLIK